MAIALSESIVAFAAFTFSISENRRARHTQNHARSGRSFTGLTSNNNAAVQRSLSENQSAIAVPNGIFTYGQLF
ncbi:hypothetical protein [Nostoc sp. CENA543]|uniref:hypothetical protein n=1 Tax=Nostoc sp. CENA543 TaxID=1869241 RepID=UPI0012FFEDA7|nr:hypothetical protein [Nostoc sp. CENA543]